MTNRIGRFIGGQLQNPSGFAGRCLGPVMAVANYRVTREAIGLLDVRPAHRILELGFGSGHGIARLGKAASSGRVLGIDQSAAMLRQACKRNAHAIRDGRIRLRQGQFERLPFPDNSFDRLIAINVVYFWPRNTGVMQEIDRVTKDDSRIVLYATHKASMEKWFFARTGSHRLYDESDMKNLFLEAGFPSPRIDIRSERIGFGLRGVYAIATKGISI